TSAWSSGAPLQAGGRGTHAPAAPAKRALDRRPENPRPPFPPRAGGVSTGEEGRARDGADPEHSRRPRQPEPAGSARPHAGPVAGSLHRPRYGGVTAPRVAPRD